MFVSEWLKAAKAEMMIKTMIERVCRKNVTSKIQPNLGMPAHLHTHFVFKLLAPVSFVLD